MIKVFSYEDRWLHHETYNNMLKARASVFQDRLKWDVCVKNGREEDDYDRKYNPLYIVSERPDGSHATSMRVLPTTGPTMLRDIFHQFFPDCPDIYGANIWETTRYCATFKKGDPITYTGELFGELCRVCLASGIDHLTGIFFKPMHRIFCRAGWEPVPVMSAEHDGKTITLATFEVSQAQMANILNKFSLSP
ncbi:hypothetical protein NKW84_11470 [Acetobacter senegalensis]|uniref:acyl-homoserine-lactone synthase n=1 Tax=Acetobacter senegalensis TaxID=446692 RepID=UPI0020A2106B|nr:hypothetical protein [Acetobacter senegalensis]